MRWTEHVMHTREMKDAYRILVGKPEGKGPLLRPECRWKNHIKWVLKKKDWNHLTESRDQW
jgi:hypothetical protein